MTFKEQEIAIISILTVFSMIISPLVFVPAGSPSRGGDVTVYVFDTNQLSLPAPFYSTLLSISVFMALALM